MKKLLNTLLVLSMAFGMLVGVKANQSIINSISVNKNDMMHLDSFDLSVDFGGDGTTVYAGQRVPIQINTQDVRLSYNLPLKLSMDGIQIANVVEDGNGFAIVFTEEAANLDDINGSFNLIINAAFTGDLNEPGSGNIEIEAGNSRETISVNYPGPGGTETDKVYSKGGVYSTTETNKVDWIFDFNAAKKPVDYYDAQPFTVTDTLDDTMVWDVEFNNSNSYVVFMDGPDHRGQWYSIEQAKELGVHVKLDSNGKDLEIVVDHLSNVHGRYVATLNETNISVRLTAIVSDDVIDDESIKTLTNKSEVDFNAPDNSWVIEPGDKESTVDINRQGGSASGTKRGTLNVLKQLEGSSVGIEGVEFDIKRKDGKNIVISGVNHGKTLTEKTDSNGELNIKGLPVTTYVITEKGAPDWIEFDPETPIEQEFTIEDKETTDLAILNSKKLIDFTVEKEWFGIDGTSIDGKSIKVQLYRNEEAFGSVVEMKDSHTWEDLEMADDNGNLYVYTAKEVGEDGGKVKLSNEEYEVEYIHSDSKTQISNTLIQEKIDIKGEKTWNDLNDKLGLRPESIEISLLANGEVVETLTVTEEDEWKWSFIDLDKYQNGEQIVYSISETSVDHYSSEIDGFNVINAVTPEKTSVQVTKTWDMVHGDSPESVTVKLFANGVDTGKEIVLTEDDNWVGTFKGLEMYDENLDRIKYTVEEVHMDGFIVSISGDMENGFVIKNSQINPKVDIKGEKTWNDLNDKLGLRPESIEISLLANGEVVETLTVTEEDEWKWSFIDLDKYQNGEEIVYSISETSVDHYSSEIDGFNVTNTLTPDKTSLQITKVWKDDGTLRPESIVIKLYANGVDTGEELILTEEDNWVGTFKDLEMYDENLDRIEYTIEEVKVDGYSVSIEGDMDTGYVVTNTHVPEDTPVNPPKDKPREPEVASVNRPKPEELPVTGSSSIVVYGALVMVGVGLLILIKKRKEYN